MADFQDPMDDQSTLGGGPVVDPIPAEEPPLVTVRVSGKTLSVPQDVADAILEREEQFNRKLSEQGAELGQLRKQTQPKPEPEPAPDDTSADLEFFQSPSQAIARREAQLREQLKQEIFAEYRMERAREAWWNEFWKENPTMVGRERLVGAVMQQEFENIKDLPPDKARKALSEAVKDLIHGGQQRQSTRTTLPNRAARTERPSGTNPPPAPPAPDEPSTYGLSDVIRARRAARRRASTGQP